MADIQVVFQNKKPTLVLQDPEAVMQEEILNWHFHTAGTPVRAVRITFAKKSARFFPRPTHLPKPARKPDHKIKKAVTNGQTIWGKAPAYFKSGPPKSRSDKYTIEAFDASDARISWATLDPTIRTDGP